MDVEVKQRNRRRRRAQRMQAQREGKADRHDGPDSGDDDENVVREKPQRPHNRRKKNKEPLVEEDIVEGFSILQFRSYEDLEVSSERGGPHTLHSQPTTTQIPLLSWCQVWGSSIFKMALEPIQNIPNNRISSAERFHFIDLSFRHTQKPTTRPISNY
jgi:hypothetical protein